MEWYIVFGTWYMIYGIWLFSICYMVYAKIVYGIWHTWYIWYMRNIIILTKLAGTKVQYKIEAASPPLKPLELQRIWPASKIAKDENLASQQNY